MELDQKKIEILREGRKGEIWGRDGKKEKNKTREVHKEILKGR